MIIIIGRDRGRADDDDDDDDDNDNDDDDDLYLVSIITIIISLLLYCNDDHILSPLLDLGNKVPKKGKSSEFNSGDDGIVI